jgi:hypothetical protein
MNNKLKLSNISQLKKEIFLEKKKLLDILVGSAK